MSGKTELLDSNILIYLSRRELSLVQVIKPDKKYLISIVSLMEVLGFPFANIEEENFVTDFVSSIEVLEVTIPIAQQVIKNQKRNHIALPDAIIGATAQVYNCSLVTRNVEDFSTIEGLTIINPFR